MTAGPGPNEACTCGTGRKLKHCHEIPAGSPPTAWIRYFGPRRARQMLLIDETRFGGNEGFDEERVLFVGVLINAIDLLYFGKAVQQARALLDDQKRDMVLKSKQVLTHVRIGSQLRAAASLALSNSTLFFWVATTHHLMDIQRERQGPAIRLADGSFIDGPESPVVEMIAGFAADRSPEAMAEGRLEVFVDSSDQNGLQRGAPEDYSVYTALGGAPAVKDGAEIRLGARVRRRIFAVRDETTVFGDWLILPDLVAALSLKSGDAATRVRAVPRDKLLAIDPIPGTGAAADLARYVAPIKKQK